VLKLWFYKIPLYLKRKFATYFWSKPKIQADSCIGCIIFIVNVISKLMWTYPYLSLAISLAVTHSSNPTASSLEVCSLTNQGRYLQRLAQGSTITFVLNVVCLMYTDMYKTGKKVPWAQICQKPVDKSMLRIYIIAINCTSEVTILSCDMMHDICSYDIKSYLLEIVHITRRNCFSLIIYSWTIYMIVKKLTCVQTRTMKSFVSEIL